MASILIDRRPLKEREDLCGRGEQAGFSEGWQAKSNCVSQVMHRHD